jgi:ABC-type glutathione transport system ATPase component
MLEIEHLKITTPKGNELLKDVTFSIKKGKITGLTGESGAGKTTIVKSIMGMLDRGFKTEGVLKMDSKSLSKLSNKQRRYLCGTTIGFIPQIPMTAFDPRLTIKNQLCETFRYKLKCTQEEAIRLSTKCLEKVNLNDTERILKSKPSNLSGGMLQRISFAFQMGLNPTYILADEPTSALDNQNRDIILALLQEQKESAGILFVSHDYAALEKICDKIIVISKGESSSYDSFSELTQKPQNNWTEKFVQHHENLKKGGFIWKEL